MSSGTPSITNCYYTQALGAAQGTEVYFGTASAPGSLGDLETDYGMVKVYANGLFYNGKYYNSGAGSESNPYVIDSKEALARIALMVNSGTTDFVDKHFSLTCDLDLSGQNWMPIGTQAHPFKGNFDGGNHVISNITVNNPSGSFNGLFGNVKGFMEIINANDLEGSKYIRNIVVKNASIQGGDYTGAIAGQMEGAVSVSNLVVDGSTVKGNNYTGGIIGQAMGYRDQAMTVECYTYIELNNFLFVNGTACDKDNKSYPVLGYVKLEDSCSDFYFSGVDGAVEGLLQPAYISHHYPRFGRSVHRSTELARVLPNVNELELKAQGRD